MLTNRINVTYNMENIDSDFDIFRVEKANKDYYGCNILDSAKYEFKAVAVQWSFGATALVLFRKGDVTERKFKDSIMEEYKDVRIQKINVFDSEQCDKYFYYDKKTGKEIDENTPDNRIGVKELEQKEMTYTICAKVIIPDTISYRFYNGKQYILGSEAFVKDTGINNVMSYLVNIDDGKEEQFEKFLEYYTTNIDSALDYESKISYQKNFGSYRDMFVNVGSAAAFIIGLIGMLNFFNTIFTGINSRKREFAVMQAVGMTGVQLKRMLICEGMIYTCMAVVISFIVCAISEPVLMDVLSGVYWFFTSKWTLFPVLVLAPVYAIIGAAVPLVLYPSVAKKSVVDRLKV